jgi:hypothetical protein
MTKKQRQMSLSQLKPINRSEIIEIFEGLPPDECFSLDLTKAQIEKWDEAKKYWRILKKALVNYFSGKYILEDLSATDPRNSGFLELALQRYLSMYDLINWGWRDIQEFHKHIEMPAKEPGQAFAYILREKAICDFLDEGKTSPRTLYEGYKYLQHCQGLERLGQLTEQQTTKLAIFARRIRKKSPFAYPDYLLFLDCCRQACRISTDSKVRRKLKEFEKLNAEWQDALLSYLHPRKAGKLK